MLRVGLAGEGEDDQGGVSARGIADLAKLEHLQQFLFVEDNHDYELRHIRVFRLCLKLLPGLWFCGKMIKIELHNTVTTYDRGPFYGLQRPWPSALALRQLLLRFPTRMPVGVELPNLETLYVHHPRASFSLLGLSSLTKLALDRLMGREQLEQILGSVGHQLTSLAASTMDTLFVDRVFSMCPNLQHFFITSMPPDFIGLNEPLPNDLQSLVEFGIAEMPYSRPRSRFQPDHLLQILRALPNLSVLRFTDYWFDEHDSALICEALAKKGILRNLAELYLTNEEFAFAGVIPRNDEEVQPPSIQEAANKVLRSLIDHCPRLSTVKLKRSVYSPLEEIILGAIMPLWPVLFQLGH
jgi:hypothetical protein